MVQGGIELHDEIDMMRLYEWFSQVESVDMHVPLVSKQKPLSGFTIDPGNP